MTASLILRPFPSRRLGIVLASLALLETSPAQQIQAITASFSYSLPLNKRLNVQTMSGIGGRIRMSIGLSDELILGLNSGYSSYSVNQTDQLNRWNWNFWNERYYNKIQADLRADPSLSVNYGSVQKMDFIPVVLTLAYAIKAQDDLVLAPMVGAGMIFYARTLYIDETWTKVFPAAAYSFTYSFRNFAPAKKGNLPVVNVGCDIRYQLFSEVGLQAGVLYEQFLPFNGGTGYGEFLTTNDLTLSLGLTFQY